MSSHLKISCAMMVLFAFAAFAAETEYLANSHFQNGAEGWTCTGNVAFQQDGADVVLLAGGEKKAMLIQPDLKPPLAAPLTISWEAEGDGGAARYRIYLETSDNINGAYGNHDSYGTPVWRDAQPGWKPCRVDLSLPNPFDYCYLVLQIAGDSTHPVRLRNLSFRLDENAP